ncbi:uncharacterized protein BO80DRAFT_448494 [Aspergillus ibericus CBS 121593]|uniref:Uncharacterized protein n=1 Tax=Aspergillus ibericus CBS 121593 TaxID=1448316 RepID=A0A395GP78_9EURO|nr:hypothetical protein BO80DRAFT_448494 [Aspergillus ibericus CBS 121593]RAK97320.1 hypothetical protein BO80DRAFT_448494 [Aspergillus ibericus CBS 121593]
METFQAQLFATLGTHPTLIDDILHIIAHQGDLTSSSHTRAEAAISHRQYLHWCATSNSSELLIQNDPDSTHYTISGVSLFSARFLTSPEDDRTHIRLAWFCSLHDNPSRPPTTTNNPNPPPHPGGAHAMLSAFIIQLLRQLEFEFISWPGIGAWEIQLQALARGELGTLATLFEWLVCNVPSETVLSIVIDDVGRYGTGQYLADMLAVVRMVLALRRSTRGVRCVVKVLVTCSEGVDEVREMFRGEEEQAVVEFGELRVRDWRGGRGGN